jgi:hypothetical protein
LRWRIGRFRKPRETQLLFADILSCRAKTPPVLGETDGLAQLFAGEHPADVGNSGPRHALHNARAWQSTRIRHLRACSAPQTRSGKGSAWFASPCIRPATTRQSNRYVMRWPRVCLTLHGQKALLCQPRTRSLRPARVAMNANGLPAGGSHSHPPRATQYVTVTF